MRENTAVLNKLNPPRPETAAASNRRPSPSPSRVSVLAALALVAAACGHDHGHDHDHDHDHDHHPHGIAEEVEAAVCGDSEASGSVVAVGSEETAPTVATDGDWFTIEADQEGNARVAFETTVEHGNWRVLVGPDATLTAIEGPYNVDLELEPVDGTCTERFEYTALLHIHTPERWELLFVTEPNASFALAVVLEFVGH